MPIKSRRNFKTVLGAADLELVAKKGESLLVRNVMIYEPVANYAHLMIGKTSVGFFRVASLLGNHLQIPFGRAYHSHDFRSGSTAVGAYVNGALLEDAGNVENANMRISNLAADTTVQRMVQIARSSSVKSQTILQYLSEKGLFAGYPVESGETFYVLECDDAASVKIVEYDIYDEPDITSIMPNGSKATEFIYISYGDTGANIQAQINPTLNQSNNPPEFPDFPFGEVVPSGQKMEILGILASDVAPAANNGANATQTEYLRIMQGREFLFDEDHNGLLYYAPFATSVGNENMIAEGYAVGGNLTQCDRRDPLMFDPPLVFTEGEEITVQWHTVITGAGAAISEELQEVAFILRMSPIT